MEKVWDWWVEYVVPSNFQVVQEALDLPAPVEFDFDWWGHSVIETPQPISFDEPNEWGISKVNEWPADWKAGFIPAGFWEGKMPDTVITVQYTEECDPQPIIVENKNASS